MYHMKEKFKGETLANDHIFAKFKPSKFYFSNTPRVAEAKLANYVYR